MHQKCNPDPRHCLTPQPLPACRRGGRRLIGPRSRHQRQAVGPVGLTLSTTFVMPQTAAAKIGQLIEMSKFRARSVTPCTTNVTTSDHVGGHRDRVPVPPLSALFHPVVQPATMLLTRPRSVGSSSLRSASQTASLWPHEIGGWARVPLLVAQIS